MEKKLTKQQIVEQLAEKEQISKVKAKETLETIIEIIQEGLKTTGGVELRGLGTFHKKIKPEVTRKVFGEIKTLPEKTVVKFSASKKLLEELGK